MQMKYWIAALISPLVFVLAACSSEPASPEAELSETEEASMSSPQITRVTASVFYRERIALSPVAVLVATIEIEETGMVVAEVREEVAGRSVPIPLALEVDRSSIPEDSALIFRATIEVDGFTSWRSEPISVSITSGPIDLGSVMLMSVAVPDASTAEADPTSELAGTWAVEDIGGGGIIDSSRVTLVFDDQRVAGQASCNSYQGRWSLENGKLAIVDVAATLMACPDALMNQERRFLDALAAADGMRFDATGALFLTSDGDDLLEARLELQGASE